MSKVVVDLRRSIQGFVRAFGLLSGDETPCGQPLAPSHAHALLILLERERTPSAGRLNQQELATALGLDKSSITRLCSKMVAAGHLQQVPSETDGRAWTLGLSAKGRRVAGTLDEASKDRFRRLAAALGTTMPIEDVIHVLQTLTEAVVASSESLPS